MVMYGKGEFCSVVGFCQLTDVVFRVVTSSVQVDLQLHHMRSSLDDNRRWSPSPVKHSHDNVQEKNVFRQHCNKSEKGNVSEANDI